jgi:hypothetical protein
VKNVILLVSEKKNIHTHFDMQTDDALLHGNRVHKHVSKKWILTISEAHFSTCRHTSVTAMKLQSWGRLIYRIDAVIIRIKHYLFI